MHFFCYYSSNFPSWIHSPGSDTEIWSHVVLYPRRQWWQSPRSWCRPSSQSPAPWGYPWWSSSRRGIWPSGPPHRTATGRTEFKSIANAEDSGSTVVGRICCGLWLSTRDAPDTDLVGYPANPKAGYRISGGAGYWISGYFLTYHW